MDIKALKQQVEAIVGISLSESEMNVQTWDSLIKKNGKSEFEPIRLKDRIIWLWFIQVSRVHVLEAEAGSLTDAEIKLIALLLSALREQHKLRMPLKRDDESLSVELGEWLEDQIERSELHAPVPEHIATMARLKGRMLPFLLNWDNQAQQVSFAKLHKLLRSYFGGEIVLVPLKEEWLILLGEELLNNLREESEEGAEAEREMLGDLCQGLYELITNEWVGGFQLTVSDTLIGYEELPSATLALRETMMLGRLFHVTKQIHLPWELKLEKLVYSIPENQRLRFIEETGDHGSLLQDEEIRSTLEMFFQLDCNVSETAKHLYIHRNTLLYRMDKFKQETGLDVRTFRDAVLVKLELLLYKVTKRS